MLDQRFRHVLTGAKRVCSNSNLMHFLKNFFEVYNSLGENRDDRSQVFYKKGYPEKIIKNQLERGNTCVTVSS